MRTVCSKPLVIVVAFMLGNAAVPNGSHAFCGFYVGGADATLTNNATLVVLMRDGTRTVLSMQNDYQGPPADFALVVPVPVVLQEENVRTLPTEVFDRVDQLASPRLVEYWEQDPCAPPAPETQALPMPRLTRRLRSHGFGGGDDLGVTVEAQFEVGEYDIVILSARDSSGLDTWLRREQYNIPEGAGDVLRPYVEQGTKFFVAKVNVERVTFRDGRAILSPLRVHYDDERFSLPVRLGLLNSAGTQDLVVHILARNQRYEMANYENVTIPTNLDVSNDVRERFSEFYASLFDRTLEQNPGAVVTEYAWQATNCDPCPGPVLTMQDLFTLGADVLTSSRQQTRHRGAVVGGFGIDFVLTRLHYRYGRDGLDEDLVFRAARPIVGGREVMRDTALEHGAAPDSYNNFQARYAIRHPWEGEIACDNPVRGRWGGPPSGGENAVRPARDVAMAPRGNLRLPSMLRTDAPEIEVQAELPPVTELLTSRAEAQAPAEETGEGEAEAQSPPASAPEASGCGSCAAGRDRAPRGTFFAFCLAFAAAFWRRRLPR